jgi:hypothetical protein
VNHWLCCEDPATPAAERNGADNEYGNDGEPGTNEDRRAPAPSG